VRERGNIDADLRHRVVGGIGERLGPCVATIERDRVKLGTRIVGRERDVDALSVAAHDDDRREIDHRRLIAPVRELEPEYRADRQVSPALDGDIEAPDGGALARKPTLHVGE